MKSIKAFLDKYSFPILLLYAFIISLTYVFPSLYANKVGGIIFRAVLLFLLLFFFTLFFISHNRKPSILFIILSSIYLICNVVAVFLGPTIANVKIDTITYFYSLAMIGTNIISCYFFLYFSKDITTNNEKIIKISILSFIGLVTLLCIYTYIFEYKDIYNTLTNEYGWNYDVTSIFVDKTTYGHYLFIGLVLSIIYILKFKNYRLYYFSIFFFINMFISRSKTSLIASIPLLIFALVLLLIHNFKVHKKKAIIVTSILSSLLLILLVLTICKVSIFERLNYFISTSIINDAKVVVIDRINKWKECLANFNNPFAIILGYGERIGPSILKAGDNAYIYTLAGGGIIKLLILLFIYVYSIIRIIKNSNLSKVNKVFSIVLIVMVLLSGLTDVIIPIGASYSQILFGLIFFLTPNILEI